MKRASTRCQTSGRINCGCSSRDIKRAVRHDLFDVDRDGPAAAREELEPFAGLVDRGATIDAQPGAVGEIDDQATDLRVVQDLAEAHEGVIAIEFRECDASAVQHPHQTGPAALE